MNPFDEEVELFLDSAGENMTTFQLASISAQRSIAHEQNMANLIAYMQLTGDMRLLDTVKSGMGLILD